MNTHQKNQQRKDMLASMEVPLSLSDESKRREQDRKITTAGATARASRSTMTAKPAVKPTAKGMSTSGETPTVVELEEQRQEQEPHQTQGRISTTEQFLANLCILLISWLPVSLGVIASISSFQVLRGCSFFHVQLRNPQTGEPIEDTQRGYGFHSREIEVGEIPDDGVCRAYSAEEQDFFFSFSSFQNAEKCAKSAAILGTILTALVFCTRMLSLLPFRDTAPSTLRLCLVVLSCILYAATAILQGLSLLAYETDFCQIHICKAGTRTGLTLFTLVLWLTILWMIVAKWILERPITSPTTNFGSCLATASIVGGIGVFVVWIIYFERWT